MRVLAHQDLAVTLHIPDADVRPSQHGGDAGVTSCIHAANGAGDVSADEAATLFTGTTTSMWWLKAIDVSTCRSSTGAIVAFGDSITDGTCTTVDAHDRWEEVLAVRLALDADESQKRRDAHKAVINEGIGGNTVTGDKLQPPPDSPPGLNRLANRDVLSHGGVARVIFFHGHQ